MRAPLPVYSTRPFPSPGTGNAALVSPGIPRESMFGGGFAAARQLAIVTPAPMIAQNNLAPFSPFAGANAGMLYESPLYGWQGP